MKQARRAALALAALLACAAPNFGTAHAASPAGQWTVSFYSEPDLAATATQGVCFKVDRTWYSTTVPWRGSWFKEGDRFRWYGTSITTATGTFGQFVSNRLITGEFAEFELAGGTTFNVGNWSLRYNGSNCGTPAFRGAAPAKVGVTR